MEKIKRSAFTCPLIAIAFILEWIPRSAALRMADPLNAAGPDGPGSEVIRFYSYFSLEPCGYGNIGPFLSGISTAAALIFGIIYALSGKLWALRAEGLLCITAVFLTFLPLFIRAYVPALAFVIALAICVQTAGVMKMARGAGK